MTRVNLYLYPAIALVVFLGVIGAATLTPYWSTTSRGLSGLASAETAGESGPAKLVDTAEIRGTWTLADAASTFEVPVDEIKAHFGIPADVSDSTALKDVTKAVPEFETSLLREWLKERSPVAVK